jgi:hypothetical protein
MSREQTIGEGVERSRDLTGVTVPAFGWKGSRNHSDGQLRIDGK